MQLKHIDLSQLTVSAANMRGKGKGASLDNILPSIRARGVLVPLIVRAVGDGAAIGAGAADFAYRPKNNVDTGDNVGAILDAACQNNAGAGRLNGNPSGLIGDASADASDGTRYEIIAGRRRFEAMLEIAAEGGEIEPLPCAIIDGGDDASALEASLIENIARLDPDEVSRWETFTRLVREGRSPEDVALTFGLTELQVRRTLALGNLLPRIRTLYRREEIDAITVRHLTLASKARQRDWLALVDDEQAYAPRGSQLKAWLFGGASIATSVALFDLAEYPHAIVTDLFGEDSYFAESEQFWAAQHAAVQAKADAYREAGWSHVIVLEAGHYFNGWEHERRSKAKGGKVIIAVGPRGEVTVHEGYISLKEARRERLPDMADKPKRPELTAPLANYIDLHRHAAVRARVAGQPDVALRLMLAHAMVGSGLWSVRIEPQRAANDSIAESVETSASEAIFDQRRRTVLAALGLDADAPTVTGGYEGTNGLSGLFMTLLALSDEAAIEAIAIVMAETLDAGSALVETLGRHLAIDMTELFAVDQVMLDLIKDRDVLDALVAELAGQNAADANAKATGKVKREIVGDCLSGSNGRTKVERFVPRWMSFPPSAYTARGGVETVNRAAMVDELFTVDPEAEAPADGPSSEPVGADPAADETVAEAA